MLEGKHAETGKEQQRSYTGDNIRFVFFIFNKQPLHLRRSGWNPGCRTAGLETSKSITAGRGQRTTR